MTAPSTTPPHGPSPNRAARGEPSLELSERRTGLAFQRTRLSADRTLMSTIRTSLSLITFGFTIFQYFERLRGTGVLVMGSAAPRRFGLALVSLGVGMLVLGIGYQLAFMGGVRRLRKKMKADGLIHGESHFPVSLTLLVAIALLAIGTLAIASMVLGTGPFR